MEEEDKNRLRDAHESMAKAFDYIYDKEQDLLAVGIRVGSNPEDRILIPVQSERIPEEDLDKERQEELDKVKVELGKCFEEIVKILKYYTDLKEENYSLLAIWIIGAHMIETFNTYPYLFINAPKGSGKSRLLNLIMNLSGGRVLGSITETALFRSKGALGIDEFEGITRKGSEGLKELLNSAYKKGLSVIRYKKVKSPLGEEQVEEEFKIFRPIGIANIWGMDEVLGDRCFHIIIDKSNNPLVTKKIEIFHFKEKIDRLCRLCHVVTENNVYNDIERGWNDYLENKYNRDTNDITTLTTLTTQTTLKDKLLPFFNKIDDSGLNGRVLEMSLPLLFLANFLREELFVTVLSYLQQINEEKKSEDMVESYDISLLDFVSGQIDNGRFVSVSQLAEDFRKFLNSSEEWLNSKWMGRALKRLNLIVEKRRKTIGREVRLNISKATEKIKIFRPSSPEVPITKTEFVLPNK